MTKKKKDEEEKKETGGSGASSWLTNYLVDQGMDYLLGGSGTAAAATPEAASLAADTFLASEVPAFSLGADAAATGFNLAGDVPVAFTSEGLTSGLSEAGSSIAPVAGPLALAAGLYGGYNTYKNIHKMDKKQGALSGGASGAAAGAGIGTMIAPGVGTAIGAGIGALAGGLLGLTAHEGTRQTQQRRWGSLAEAGYNKEDLAKLFAAAHPERVEGAPVYQGLGAEQEANLAKGVSKGLNPTDMWGHYGVMESAGPDYLSKWTEKQRYDYTQGLIEQNLLDSRKGDVIVTDHDAAAKLKEDVLNGTYKEIEGQEYDPAKIKAPEPISGGETEPETAAGGTIVLKMSGSGGGDVAGAQREADKKALALTLANNAISQGTARVRGDDKSPWSNNMKKYLYGNPGYGY